MNHAELLTLLNHLLVDSRTAIKESKAILQRTAARMLEIQRDEADASAVLIQLVKSLGGRPNYGIESTDDIARASALASRLALFGREQLRVADELEGNLQRVADDRVRHRLQRLLIARVRNIRRLDGERHSPVDFIGFPSTFFEKALYSVTALTQSVVAPIPFRTLLGLFDRHPRLAAAIFWSFACEAGMYAEHLIDVGRRSALERVSHFLARAVDAIESYWSG
jgi:hypothetical protein